MSDDSTFPQGSEILELPVLPLRNSVLFPQVVIPLAVGREKSIALIKDAAKRDSRIAIFTQRESEIEEPGEADLYRVGTSARILKVVKIAHDNYSVIIQGQERIRLRGVTQVEPYLIGEFEVLEEVLGRKAILNVMPTQDGEMTRTEADVTETRAALGYDPSTPIDLGVRRFVDWYRDFYGV